MKRKGATWVTANTTSPLGFLDDIPTTGNIIASYPDYNSDSILKRLLNEGLNVLAVDKMTDPNKVFQVAVSSCAMFVVEDLVDKIFKFNLQEKVIFNPAALDWIKFAIIAKTTDQAFLRELVRVSPPNLHLERSLPTTLKAAAIRKITDQDFLQYIVTHSKEGDIIAHAVSKITDQKVLKDFIPKLQNELAINVALTMIEDENFLFKLATKARLPLSAIHRIIRCLHNEGYLLALAASRNLNEDTRALAFSRVNDPYIIKKVAEQREDSIMKLQSIERVTDKRFLSLLLIKEDRPVVKNIIDERLNHLDELEQKAGKK